MEVLRQTRRARRDDPLRDLYAAWRPAIEERLGEFETVWRDGSDADLFAEMAFCLCAVQTGAARCDAAVRDLRERGQLLDGTSRAVAQTLVAHGVRFHWTKGERIVRARRQFLHPVPALRRALEERAAEVLGLRAWLQERVVGFGWKEASHFLRNVGLGHDLAILDRHILRNLHRLGVLDALPTTLAGPRYLAVEEAMRRFCGKSGIPMSHLDLLLWARETGYVFK